LKSLHVPIIADQLTHQQDKPGSPAPLETQAKPGSELVDVKNKLKITVLRKIVFDVPQQRRRL
jgi:dephospho-CoA kinase